MAISYCPRCGAQIEGDATFCYKCGAALGGTDDVAEQPVAPVPAASQPIAAAQSVAFKPKTPATLIVACCLGLLGSGLLWLFSWRSVINVYHIIYYYVTYRQNMFYYSFFLEILSLIFLIAASVGSIIVIKKPKLAGFMMLIFAVFEIYTEFSSRYYLVRSTFDLLYFLLNRLIPVLPFLAAGCLAFVGAKQKRLTIEQTRLIPAPPVMGPPSRVLAIVKASGGALAYDAGKLAITGIGDVTYEHVTVLDQGGGLEWASPENRDWFYSDATRAFFR